MEWFELFCEHNLSVLAGVRKQGDLWFAQSWGVEISCYLFVEVRCELQWFIQRLLMNLNKSEHLICTGVKYV